MKQSKNILFLSILVALALGTGLGYIINHYYPETTQKNFGENMQLLSTIFIRLIKMILAPLVFTTLTLGICKMDNIKAVGRVGGRAMLWFMTASLVSLFIGLFIANLTQPGKGIDIPIKEDLNSSLLTNVKHFSLNTFVEHLVPDSMFGAMANNEILQIVVFSILFGIAMNAMGSSAKKVQEGLEIVSLAVLKMVHYIMWVAPIAVFGSITAAVAQYGFSVFEIYWKFFFYFIVGIVTLCTCLLIVGYIVLGKDLFRLLKHIKVPLLVAFSTTSSEAVLPRLTEELEHFGCDKKIVSMTLPLGYSFNLDGGLMYITFSSIFLAQFYDVHMSLSTQITMLLVLMLTSKGVAGVPRAGLIIVVANCAMFGINPAGITLLLPIDYFCDMFRTTTNVLGNSLATAAVSKWEGKLTTPETK